MRIQGMLAIGALLLFAGGCASPYREASYPGQVISSPYYRRYADDRALETTLRSELNRYGDLSSVAPNIQISAQNGTVTLTGPVPSERERQMMDALIRNTPGVVAVNDQTQLTYPPTSTYGRPARIYTAPAIGVLPPNQTIPAENVSLKVQPTTSADRSLADRLADRLRTEAPLTTLPETVTATVTGTVVYLQ